MVIINVVQIMPMKIFRKKQIPDFLIKIIVYIGIE